MRKVLRTGEAGFTLMEMLIVVLIVGILAAIAGPLYIGYTRDARMSEAKSIAGNIWSALQGCAQATPDVDCVASGQYGRAGIIGGTKTPDGMWDVGAGTQKAKFLGATTNTYTLDNPLDVQGVTGKVSDKLRVQFSYLATDNPPGTFKCSTDGTPPTGPC